MLQDEKIVSNTEKNVQFYDSFYAQTDLNKIFRRLDKYASFLADARITDASWTAMYLDNFQDQLKGKRVLELGCGDCLNAGLMALLGAQVFANDLSSVSGQLVAALNERYQFTHPIQFIGCDFLEADLEENTFDIVVGKAFVHHLTPEQEQMFHQKINRILKKEGKVRFVEPAENSPLLDKIRFMIPVFERPSIFQRKKFAAWKEKDTHPDRENTTQYYKEIGLQYYEKVNVQVMGCVHRLHRLLPDSTFNRKFRRWAFRVERFLPKPVQVFFGRIQTIDYAIPRKK
jgi:SAM-dependent methyltransferase